MKCATVNCASRAALPLHFSPYVIWTELSPSNGTQLCHFSPCILHNYMVIVDCVEQKVYVLKAKKKLYKTQYFCIAYVLKSGKI